ncbi:MAG TPA: methionine--tRNA ligase, partial [Aestuariivirgaceae bacterium]
HHEQQAISKALDHIWEFVGDANRYIAAEQPWSLRGTNPQRMATVLYVTAESLRQIGILIQPYMPLSAGKLLDALGVGHAKRSFAALEDGSRLFPGTVVPSPSPIFPRIDADLSKTA